MSEIKVNNLSGKTSAGDITITSGSATMQLQQGLCKSWILYNQLDTTADSVGSFNISTLVDGAQGRAIVNLSNAFGAVDYCHLIGTSTDASNIHGSGVSRNEGQFTTTTSSMEIITEVANTSSNDDRDFNSVAFVGSLA